MTIYIFYLAEEVLVLRKKWKMRKMRKKVVKATKTHTYTYESEVWRGRLNQLWFDKDPLNAGK